MNRVAELGGTPGPTAASARQSPLSAPPTAPDAGVRNVCGIPEAFPVVGIGSGQNSDAVIDVLNCVGSAYLPIEQLPIEVSPFLASCRLFGLRSRVNTVARLLGWARAPAGVAGVWIAVLSV